MESKDTPHFEPEYLQSLQSQIDTAINLILECIDMNRIHYEIGAIALLQIFINITKNNVGSAEGFEKLMLDVIRDVKAKWHEFYPIEQTDSQ